MNATSNAAPKVEIVITPLLSAIAQAIARARAYYRADYGHHEVWAKEDGSVTIRAWNTDGSDYGFWTIEW